MSNFFKIAFVKYKFDRIHTMIKITLLAIFAVSVLLTGTIAGTAVLLQPADALKSKGNSMTEIGSKKVCGDRLCSEVEQEQKPKEEKKKKEQVKQEKKAESSEKAKDAGQVCHEILTC